MNVSLQDQMSLRQNPWDNRMTSSPASSPVTEKPFHYTYLKEFRVEQCKAFLQHKCSQHRPYTCFHWHFMNQRRRRPMKKRDGTFNYSPDVYCSLYDETTGLCPNGDECPYLHRTAGDTERRYHLRYYKTSTCVYETDSRGYCIKNGPHCAFAHGPHDIRPPVYDIRELQGGGLDDEDRLVSPSLVGSLEKERGVLVDDPRWQESSFVLTYYKTGPCKRPPRLCRQGYACPFYHNNKDRRRTPKAHKYRSTPCPNVKLNDEWGDPIHCEQGDSCPYCHTRTEQQFHPEIYKSTKCNDVQQTGYCPRGPFCAFAHDEKELTSPRDLTDKPMVTSPSPIISGSAMGTSSYSHTNVISTSPHSTSLPQPIGRPSSRRGISVAGPGEGFQRAPGAEVKSKSFEEDQIALYLRKQIQAIDGDYTLDENEKSRRKQLLHKSLSSSSGMSPDTALPQAHSLPSSVSDTLEAMVGGGGLDDLTLEDIDSAGFTDEPTEMYNTRMMDRSQMAQSFLQSLHHQSHRSSSYSFSTPLGPLSPYGTHSGGFVQSHPFPPHAQAFGSGGFSSPSPLPPSTSPGPLTSPYHLQQQQRFSQAPGPPIRTPGSPNKQSPMFQAAMGSPIDKTESAALREELRRTKHELAMFHDSWKQAKQACEAWKKEAEGAANLEAKLRESEGQVRALQSAAPALQGLMEGIDINRLPLSKLEQVQQKLKGDLERVETTIHKRVTSLCTQCKEFPRCVLVQPCNHCVLCEQCSERMGSDATCPYCNEKITGCTTVILP